MVGALKSKLVADTSPPSQSGSWCLGDFPTVPSTVDVCAEHHLPRFEEFLCGHLPLPSRPAHPLPGTSESISSAYAESSWMSYLGQAMVVTTDNLISPDVGLEQQCGKKGADFAQD